jgi:hypothetical protein
MALSASNCVSRLIGRARQLDDVVAVGRARRSSPCG